MPRASRGFRLVGLKTVSGTFGKRWIWPAPTALIEDIGRAMLNLGHLLLCAGRNEECLELSEAAITENEALGLDLRRGAMNRNNASQALFALGRWDEAIAQTDIVRGRIEFRFAGRMACIIRARVATARGEDDLAASLLSWVEPDGQGQGEPDIVAYRRLVVAESAAWAGRYDEGRAAIAAGLELVAGNDALYTARLCAVGLRLEADRCISAHARRARSEEAAARQRADELVATAADVVGRGEIEAWVGAGPRRVPPARCKQAVRLAVEEWMGVRDRWRSCDSRIPRRTRACGLPKPSWRPATGAPPRLSCPPLPLWRSSSKPPRWLR